jgi:hypothetical protein
MKREAVATAFALVGIAVAGAAGCGGGSGHSERRSAYEPTYAYEPTRACLERLDHVGDFPVSVYGGNFTVLGEHADGDQFMVFFGGNPEGDGGPVGNIVYVTVVGSPGEAEQVLKDYKQHADEGEMGYSADAEVSRIGNVAFTWNSTPPDQDFKDAFEHCLKSRSS